MIYLLDTNAWLRWFHRPHEMRSAVRELLNGQRTVGLSPMSILEVTQKHSKGRLELPRPLTEWIEEAMPAEQIRLLPKNAEIAVAAYSWPEDFHGDPADRVIAATARIHHLTLVTSDMALLARADVKTLSTR